MASLCRRCALRSHRAVASETGPLVRTFTSTTSRRAHAIPKFSETANAELDDVLASMRNKHFIPAALSPAQRRLIFGHSNKQELESNPRAIEIAGERIDLQWIDRRRDIPNRAKLFRQAVKLMAEDGSKEAWANLLHLLIGLKRSGVEVSRMDMERILRLAIESGNFSAILRCLRRGDETEMTLQRPEVLEAVLLALRRMGQTGGWTQEGLDRAMRESREIAQLLEWEMHGGGKMMKKDDLRRDPRVIGVFLELSAMFAWKHQDGKDVDGRVRAYSERLLYNIKSATEMSTTELAKQGPQTDVLLSLSVWHGLRLAQNILAMDMPNPMLAAEVTKNYESSLRSVVQKLEAQNPSPSPGGYAHQALTAWTESQQA